MHVSGIITQGWHQISQACVKSAAQFSPSQGYLMYHYQSYVTVMSLLCTSNAPHVSYMINVLYNLCDICACLHQVTLPIGNLTQAQQKYVHNQYM